MKTQLYLRPADHGRALTLEELESSRAVEGFRYELIHGRLEVSPLPDLPHDDLKDWLIGVLGAYSRQYPEVINRVKGPARVFLPARTTHRQRRSPTSLVTTTTPWTAP